MKNRLAVGAVALALGIAGSASAQDAPPWLFQCPNEDQDVFETCEVIGNPASGSDYYYVFSVATAGSYELGATGSADDLFSVTIYTDLGVTDYAGPFAYDPNQDPNALSWFSGGFELAASTPYYIGADGDCDPTGGACNVNIRLREVGSGTPDSTVPEPASLLLFGTGLALIGKMRRRKQQA